MNEERNESKQSGPEYFRDVLAQIRDIRASGHEMHRRVKDVVALAADHSPGDPRSQGALLTVELLLLFAATGRTPAARIDDFFRRGGSTGTTSYLREYSKREINRLVSMFLDFAEAQAERGSEILLHHWPEQLDDRLSRGSGEAAVRTASQLDGYAAVLLKQLQLKFGSLPEPVIHRVQSAAMDELDTWAERILTATALEDVLRLRSDASFRVVHVFIVNEHDDLLLQQISREHDRHPLWWGASVAGYVAAGESYGGAAARKLKSELGIAKRPKLVGKTQMRDGQSQKLITVYALRWDGPISPNPAHFAAVQFCSLKKVLDKPETLKLRLTPTFKHIVRHLREPLEALLES